MDNFDDDTDSGMPKRRRGDQTRRQLAEYIQARLRKEKAEAKHGYQAAVARHTGVAAAHISNLISNDRRPGADFVESIAAFWGCSLNELKEMARHWKAHGWTDVPLAPRFPNRELAITTFGHQFGADTVAQLREVTPLSGADMPTAWWLKHLELIEEDLRVEREGDAAIERRREQDAADTARVAKAARKTPRKKKESDE